MGRFIVMGGFLVFLEYSLLDPICGVCRGWHFVCFCVVFSSCRSSSCTVSCGHTGVLIPEAPQLFSPQTPDCPQPW